MFAWSPFPFIRYSIALIVGILLHENYPLYAFTEAYPRALLVTLSFVATLFHFLRDSEAVRLLGGALFVLSFVALGFYITSLHQQSNERNHYTHYDHVGCISGNSDFRFF